MAITKILAETIILNEQSPSANATMPTIPAGNNRFIPVTFAMYNGGGTSSPPTAVSCNSINATKIVGDATAQTRTTTATWFFKEADAAAISGGTLISTGGTGSQKSITVEAYDNCAQTTPTNFANGYTSTSQVLTMPLTRTASSWTVAKAFTSTSGTALTFGSSPSTPQRTGTSNFTTRWMSYGSIADTAQTNNFVCNGSNFTSAHVFNIEPFPVGTIDTVNGGTYNAVKAGSAGNLVTVTGFTPTSGTIGGKAISSLSFVSGSTYSFSSANYVDTQTYSQPDTTQTLVLTDGASSPTVNIPSESPTGMTSVVVTSDVVLDNDDYLGFWMAAQGFTPVASDRFVYTTADCTVASNGEVLAPSQLTTVIWLWRNSDSKLYSFTVTINESGIVTGISKPYFLGIGIGFGI